MLRVTLSFVVAIAMLAVGAVGCASVPEPESAPELVDEPTDVDYVEEPVALIEAKCAGRCHDVDRVWAADYDEAGWRASMERHEDRGLQITAEETEVIVDYLVSQ